MANYGKIKRVKPLWSCIAMVVKENGNLEKQEGIEQVEREIKKLRRKAIGRLDEDNMFEGKITRNHHLYL